VCTGLRLFPDPAVRQRRGRVKEGRGRRGHEGREGEFVLGDGRFYMKRRNPGVTPIVL